MHKNKALDVKAKPPTGPENEGAEIALKMMQALPDAIVAFRRNRRIVFANDAAQLLFGANGKVLSTMSLDMLIGSANVVREAADSALAGNKSVTLHDAEVAGKRASRVVFCPLDDTGLYLMSVSPDTMELKSEWANQARAALKPAEMMARTLAHEIKNPLAGIQAAAQLLEKLDLKTDDKELIALIEREVERILRLIKKVDVFGEAHPHEFAAVNIHEILDQAAKVTKTTYGPDIEIEQKFDPSLPDLQGDFDGLMQAQLNLIKNAAEALPGKKGKISVRTFYDNAASYHPESRERLPVCIEIEDNGQGIDAETLRRIFEPFFTTKEGGAGLGLSIVSKIVDDHGGVIRVRSGPTGTVFRLSFPVKKAPKPEKQQKFEPPKPQEPAYDS